MKNFACILCLLIVLCGCNDSRRYRIGVSQCSQDDWRLLLNDELNREVLYHNNVDLEILSGEGLNEKQIEDLDYFKRNKFDVVLVCPNEAEALTPKIKELYDAGIPIIVFDRNTTEPCYSVYISADNYGIGEQAAEYVLENIGPSARILEVCGYAGSVPAVGRSKGFHEKMSIDQTGGEIVHQVVANWNYDDSYRQVDSLLKNGLDFNVLYAHNDRMAIGASDALKHHGVRDKVTIIGVDGVPRIGIQAVRDSLIDATFFYPTAGPLLMETAINLIHNKNYRIDTILPSPSAVTHENAETILMVNSQLEGETRRLAEMKTAITDYVKKQATNDNIKAYGLIIAVLGVVIVLLIIRMVIVKRRCNAKIEEMEREFNFRRAELEVKIQHLSGDDQHFGEEVK